MAGLWALYPCHLYTASYRWFVVAESNGNEVASDRIKAVKERINSTQIESALEIAKAILGKLKD